MAIINSILATVINKLAKPRNSNNNDYSTVMHLKRSLERDYKIQR